MYTVYHLYLHNSVEEIVIYNRLRIGHSYPTHSYLLHKDAQPLCIPCHSFFRSSVFSQNVLTSNPLELIITLLQIYLNFFHKVHPSILQYMKDICLHKKQEIRSVEHGICPIAEFTSPLLSCAAIMAIRP